MVENIWLTSALWIGLALVASLISIRTAISVALVEIVVGVFGGKPPSARLTFIVDKPNGEDRARQALGGGHGYIQDI